MRITPCLLYLSLTVGNILFWLGSLARLQNVTAIKTAHSMPDTMTQQSIAAEVILNESKSDRATASRTAAIVNADLLGRLNQQIETLDMVLVDFEPSTPVLQKRNNKRPS